jgi:hypothetical protein
MDVTLAEAYSLPEGKSKVLLQFNKITGALVGILSWVEPETLNTVFFDYVTVEEFDFENDEVVGNYPDFKVVDRRTLPSVMYEESLDAIARDKITKKYPVIQQVNVLGTAILKLSEALGIDQEELIEMRDYIDEVKRVNAVQKAFYQESPDYEYVSIEDQEAREADQMEGGLHEAYGPRTATGGRVF